MVPHRFVTLTVLGATLASLAGCRESKPPAKDARVAARGAAAGCNVLLITLDTTRADHIGCYGWQRAVTPTLDSLAKQGVRFEHAFAQAPITLTSHAVLLTGTYPPENGVRDNGRTALGPELPTLAELFRGHGYQTAAFIGSAVLAARYGLARGFDVYADTMPPMAEDRFSSDRSGDAVAANALAWLQGVAGKRFFAWVHFYDPHAPYQAPPEYAARAASAYDAEVAFMDAQIGRLVAWLQSHDLSTRTLVVVVADHGESLGEHNYRWHALLVYDSIMRVPLIFSLPGRLPENVTRSGLVRIVDIMPTILDLLGWDTPAEVSGESLLAELSGTSSTARSSYGESDNAYNDYGWAKLRCLTEEKWKYIRAPEIELYDRVADPGEVRNLAAEHADVAARMEDDLTALEADMTPRQGTTVTQDAESIAALRTLGYVAAPLPADDEDIDRKNPRDMVEVCDNHGAAEVLLRAGKTPEAIDLLERAVARSPESDAIVKTLGKAYATAELFDLAELSLQDALALQPKAADVWALLARVREARESFGPAVRACEKALELNPEEKLAVRILPDLRQALQRQTTRIAAQQDRLRTEPDSAAVALKLGQELLAYGEPGEAAGVLRQALQRHPDDGDLADSLAWILATAADEKLRDGAEALRWARVACSGEGASSASRLDTLAAALAESGDFEAAIATAQRAIDVARESGNKRRGAILARRLRYYEEKRPFRVAE